MSSIVVIRPEWAEALNAQLNAPYFTSMMSFIDHQSDKGTIIYPPRSLIFKAFDLVPPNDVKVVIIGQDPYHNYGEAMGLSFSVPKGGKVPPSLKNIYKELASDLGGAAPNHGDLTGWAQQGVFLLNAVLTVPHGSPGGHKNIGWSKFTDEVISFLSSEYKDIVFMLWGNFAKSKICLIDEHKHLVLAAAHPSPLARNAFQGCKHFSKANNYLIRCGKAPIDWQLKS